MLTVLEARCLKSVSLSENWVVVRNPLASEVLQENLFLFQLLVASGVSHGDMVGLQDRYNCSVAKVKRWGCTTKGRDEHVISGCLEHAAHMRLKRREQAREIQPSACVCCSWLSDPLTLQPTWALWLLPATARNHYPYDVGSEIKLSMCLRAIDVHIAKQFQENLHTSRGRELYYLCSEIFGRSIICELISTSSAHSSYREHRESLGCSYTLPSPQAFLDLWPRHSSLSFLIAVSLPLCASHLHPLQPPYES